MKTKLSNQISESYYLNDPLLNNFLQCIPSNFKIRPDTAEEIWKGINWKECENTIIRLQHRIWLNHNNCRILQEELINNPIAKILAVRKVGFINKGRKTAGVDKMAKPDHMIGLLIAYNLKLDGKARYIRRIWIPKPNTNEKRPLGIPTIIDRAKQALAKLAIEPQWEARFGHRTYGFRPGRNCTDAIWNIRNNIKSGPKYIYDADIEKCFDRISHNYIIKKLGFDEKDIFTKQIRAWLKAGILDPEIGKPFHPETGTAQGGVISPLLCNITLHGMEQFTLDYLKKKSVRYEQISKVKLYTYADDFILICTNKRILFLCINAINEFLGQIGLNIKYAKTKKIHTLNSTISYGLNLIEKIEDDGTYKFKEDEIYLPVVYGKKYKIEGLNTFKFLGFKFISKPAGQHHAKRLNAHAKAPIEVYVVPTTDSLKKHFAAIRKNLNKCQNPSQVVKRLSPIITGWMNYFAKSDYRTYGKIGLLRTRFNKILLNWQYRTRKTRKRIKDSWTTINNDKWRFYTIDEKSQKMKILPSHSDPKYSIVSYKPIRGNSSIYDGDIAYWSIRLKSLFGLTTLETKILAQQKGKCHCCEKLLTIDDNISSIANPNPKLTLKGKPNKRQSTRIIHTSCKYMYDARFVHVLLYKKKK